jgi:hypothetical protein
MSFTVVYFCTQYRATVCLPRICLRGNVFIEPSASSWSICHNIVTIFDNMHELYLSVFIPVVPTWSIGHPWNASFHFSVLILDDRQDSLDEWSAHRKAATNTQTQNKRRQTSMPWAGLEPTTPVFERAKTFHALDRAATAIDAPTISFNTHSFFSPFYFVYNSY